MRLSPLLAAPGAMRARATSWPPLATVSRVALGLYLVVHFVALAPCASELFSSAGMLGDPRLSPLTRAFPNVLAAWDAPGVVRGLVAGGALGSLALAAGVRPRLAALLVAYLWACLLGRNPLIRNPSIPFVGLMLVACALEPSGEAPEARAVRARLRAAFLWVLAAGYTYSGLTKLGSPTWIEGGALEALLQNPLARATPLRLSLLGLPPAWLHAASFGVLALELVYLPLSLAPRLRLPLSLAMAGMHLGLLLLVDFADLSVAMLLAHLFSLGAAWAPWARAQRARA